MPDYAGLQGKKNELIRKSRNGSLFIGDASAALISSLTGVDGALKALPTGYRDLGWLSDDGVTIPRAVDTSEVSGYGSNTPLRVDVVKDQSTLECMAIETNALAIELYTGKRTEDLTISSNGELVITKALVPITRTYRGLNLAVDEGDHGEVYIARFFPRLTITKYDDAKYSSKSDDALGYGFTFESQVDSDAGYAESWLFGGPGWLYYLDAMGFALPEGP